MMNKEELFQKTYDRELADKIVDAELEEEYFNWAWCKLLESL